MNNEPRYTKKSAFFDGIISFLWFFLSIIFCEIIIRITGEAAFFSKELMLTALFSLSAAVFFCAVQRFLPPLAAKIFTAISIGFIYAVYAFQLIYFTMMNRYCSIYSIFKGGDALEFGNEIGQAMKSRLPYLLLLLIPLALFLTFGLRLKIKKSVRSGLICLPLVLVFHFASVGCIFLYGKDYFSPYDFYFGTANSVQSVNTFGVYTAMRLDIKSILKDGDSENSASPYSEGGMYSPSGESEEVSGGTAQASAAEVSPAPVQGHDGITQRYEYRYTFNQDENCFDIDFDSLINSETNEKAKSLHQYFSGISPTKKNDHTGIFSGYNLISITAESFSPYAVSETYTPTLYKMVNEGIKFNNFYCSTWEVSTSDGEYVNFLSLVPKKGVWSLLKSAKNALPFALGNQFMGKGYITNAYHNHTYNYYSRQESHPNLGYTYKGVGNGLNIKKTWPESDLEMIDVTTGEYINAAPFHTYYMTVSGHFEHTWSGSSIASKNRSLVNDLALPESCKAYLAANIELDRAMDLLLKRLEDAGIADKTVISISPDHPPYALTNGEVSAFLGHPVDTEFEIDKSTWILYKKGMAPLSVDRPCSNYDILPTLSNLFSLPYDSRMMMGTDVFSSAPALVMLPNRSWITDKAKFNATKNKTESLSGSAIDEAYIKNMHKIVADKFAFSAKVLETGYYRYLVK